MKKIIFFMICLPIFSGCVKVEKMEATPLVTIYGILNPKDDMIRIFIGNNYKIDQPFPIDSGKYVSNALVYIYTESEKKQLFLDKTSKKYQIKNNGFLKEGKLYNLEVKIGDNQMLSKTKIPNSPTIIIDEAKVNGTQTSIFVSWKKSTFDTNNYYRLIGIANFNAPLISTFFWDTKPSIWKTQDVFHANELIKSPVGNFNFVDPFKTVEVEITLQILDKNLNDFYSKIDLVQTRTTFSNKFEAPIFFESNVLNATGVFGSIVETNEKFTLNK